MKELSESEVAAKVGRGRGKQRGEQKEAKAGADGGDGRDGTDGAEACVGMRAVVKGKELRWLCKAVKGVVKNGAFPILGCFLLRAVRNWQVWVEGTDLDVRVWGRVDAEVVVGEWSVAVNAGKFCGLLERAGDREVEMVVRGGQLEVKCGEWEALIYTLNAEDFPQEPGVKGRRDVATLPARVLGRMLALTGMSASTDATRYVLNGTCLMVDGRKVRMEATEGRRLAGVEMEAEFEVDKATVILPSRLAGLVAGALGSSDEEVTIMGELDEQGKVKAVEVVSPEGIYIWGKTLEGSWPNTAQVIPDAKDAEWVRLNVEGFVGLMQRALVLADKNHAVKVEMFGQTVTVKTATPDLGEWTEKGQIISPDHQPQKVASMGVNADYAAAVGALKCEPVDLNIGKVRDGGPMHFKAGEDVGEVRLQWEYVLMPMSAV